MEKKTVYTVNESDIKSICALVVLKVILSSLSNSKDEVQPEKLVTDVVEMLEARSKKDV